MASEARGPSGSGWRPLGTIHTFEIIRANASASGWPIRKVSIDVLRWIFAEVCFNEKLAMSLRSRFAWLVGRSAKDAIDDAKPREPASASLFRCFDLPWF